MWKISNHGFLVSVSNVFQEKLFSNFQREKEQLIGIYTLNYPLQENWSVMTSYFLKE